MGVDSTDGHGASLRERRRPRERAGSAGEDVEVGAMTATASAAA
jgi:hypothetical protein